MKNINSEITISEFKKHCLSLIEAIKDTNTSLTITKRKNPIAKVIPITHKIEPKSFFGSMKGTITIQDDIVNFTTQSEWEVNNDE